MENYQIFVSYRRDGGDALAGRIADRLTSMGYKVFFDVESMRSGTFNTQILEAISKSQDVLVILPPNALDRCENESDWVRQELAFAFRSKKNVIPVLMRGFAFPDNIPKEIEQIKYMEGIVASSEYFDAVMEKIQKLLNSKPRNKPNIQKDTNDEIKIPFMLKTKTKTVNSLLPYGALIEKGYEKISIFEMSETIDSEVNEWISRNNLPKSMKEAVVYLIGDLYKNIELFYILDIPMKEAFIFEIMAIWIVLLGEKNMYSYLKKTFRTVFQCNNIDDIISAVNSSNFKEQLFENVSLSIYFSEMASDRYSIHEKCSIILDKYMVSLSDVFSLSGDLKYNSKLKKLVLINYKYLKKKNINISENSKKIIKMVCENFEKVGGLCE